MMNENVIKEIGNNAIAAEGAINTQLCDIAPGILVAPESMKLHDLEHMLPAPRSFRGQMTTTSLDAFSDYCNEAHEAKPVIFIDTDSQPAKATAIFDFGGQENPGHCRNIATLSLKSSPELAAITRADDAEMSQQGLVDFIEDWAHAIQCKSGNDSLHIGAAINAIRHVTIARANSATHKEGNFGASTSMLDSIEAKAASDTLPEYIAMTLVPHEGFSPISITLRVSLRTSGDKPRFILRWMQKETQLQEVLKEFKKLISGKVQASQVLLGNFSKK